MFRMWLLIKAFYNFSIRISVGLYLVLYIPALHAETGVCTCTVSACINTGLSTHIPGFIKRTPKLSDQISRVTQDKLQCTTLCHTVTQLYARVWGVTPVKNTILFTPTKN